MSKSVRVGGVEVTQSKLGEMCAYLSAHGCAYVPEGHAPDIGRFRQFEGATISTPEEYVYLLCENPELDRGFRAAFIDPPRKVVLSSPIGILRGAGFPTVIAFQASQHLHDLAQVDAWADGFKGTLTPWLWVMGGTETERTTKLADIAIMAGHAMDLGEAPTGPILYQRAYDLCERVNSADMYGERSKWNAMQGPMTCALLLIDGMGEERAGAKELDTLAQIVAARWRDTMPTVLASTLGLSAWSARHARTDQPKARDMAARIVSAMCGYAQGLDREATQRALQASAINLETKREVSE